MRHADGDKRLVARLGVGGAAALEPPMGGLPSLLPDDFGRGRA